MSDWTPPATDKAVEAPPKWTPPAADRVAGSPPPAPAPEPKTTASGVAASAARGSAPYAAGALAGAALGAPFAGVGAAPGALAGMGAVGLSELGGTLYNAVANRTKLPQVMTPQEGTDRLMDTFGIKRPSNATERAVEMGASMAPGGIGSAKGATELADMVAANRAGAGERYVQRLYQQTIKPSTVGRDTVAQRRSAINDIITNKADLQYVDEAGNAATKGHLPETVGQFAHAVDHSKEKLFQQWDALDKAAGAVGARVDVRPIVQVLRGKAADPVLLRQNPGAAKEANRLADEYEAAGSLSPSEAQRDITAWNKKLDAYYKKGAAEGTDISSVQEAATKVMRAELDQTIESTVAPGYQALKNRYGSLSAIEGDVDRAARRIGNSVPGGLWGKGANTVAAIEALHGLATGDLKTLVGAAATKGAAEYMKWRNEPNRVIKEMFKAAEKYHKEGAHFDDMAPRAVPTIETGMQPPRPTAGALPPGSAGVPAPPGGSAVAAPPTPLGPGPGGPRPQFPQSDFERVIGGGRELF